jgi:hypothetical protein
LPESLRFCTKNCNLAYWEFITKNILIFRRHHRLCGATFRNGLRLSCKRL